MVNLIIGQSGGPTAAINATLCGVIQGALASEFSGKILGMRNGIEGLLNEQLIDLREAVTDMNMLLHTPAAFLGSCRYKMKNPEIDDTDYKRAFEVFEKHNIRYFFYIGGNDSMDTVYRLSKYAENRDIKIIGIPKTIDNDLALTDHTPGYGSAAKFIATAVKEMARDTQSYKTKSVMIIEVMGRNTGWLAASSVLARGDGLSAPDLIYLPEVPFVMDEFIKDVQTLLKKQDVVIAVISEGIKDKDGVYICESVASGAIDVFGHKYLTGSAKVLEKTIRDQLKVKARAVELSMLQRCASHIASKTDLDEALTIGKAAFNAAKSGITGYMMGYVRQGPEYHIICEPMDISLIANIEKLIPRTWINERGNDVTEEFIKYAKPLIIGESFPDFVDGLPVHHMRVK